MYFGENLRSERQRKGITQKLLAEKAGVSTAAIAQYELGTKSPSIVTAERIAEALGVRLEKLLKPRKE